MFETNALYKSIVRKEPNGFDSQLWEVVELSNIKPWFIVVYTNKDLLGKNFIRSDMLFYSYEQIVSLAKISAIHFECVKLVSPDVKNQSTLWNIDELSEIWEGTERRSVRKQTGVVYVLKNGSRLTYSRENDEKTLLNLHRVYPPQ